MKKKFIAKCEKVKVKRREDAEADCRKKFAILKEGKIKKEKKKRKSVV